MTMKNNIELLEDKADRTQALIDALGSDAIREKASVTIFDFLDSVSPNGFIQGEGIAVIARPRRGSVFLPSGLGKGEKPPCVSAPAGQSNEDDVVVTIYQP